MIRKLPLMNTLIRPLTLLFIFILLYSIPSISQDYAYNIKYIPDSLLTNAYSIVRIDSQHVEFKENETIIFRTKVISVLDIKHKHKLEFVLGFDKSNTVENLTLEYLDEKGASLKKVKPKEIEDHYSRGQGFELITDRRYRYYSFEKETFPITIKYSYTLRDKNRINLMPWVVYDTYNTSIQRSVLEVDNTIGVTITEKSENLEAYPIKTTPGKSYKAIGCHALNFEKWSSSIDNYTPRVQFSIDKLLYYEREALINDWQAYGIWKYNEMYAPKQNLKVEEVKATFDPIIGHPRSPYQIAETVYYHIQDNFRYVAIMLGDGGWSPISMKDVHEKKYGDCKALSHYYHYVLQCYGIKSDLALIYASRYNQRNADEDFYSPTQFNHVITSTYIEGDTIWNDCTSTSNPFGYIGGFDDDRKVLLINKSKGEIVKTPSYNNQEKIEITINIEDENQGISGTYRISSYGLRVDSKLEIDRLSEDDKKDYIKRLFKKFEDYSVSTSTYSFDTINLVFVEEYKFTASSPFNTLGDYEVFPINTIGISTPKLSKSKNRTSKTSIGRPFVKEVVIDIFHPKSWVPKSQKSKEIQSDFGTYTLKTFSDEQKSSIYKYYDQSLNYIPPEAYKELRSFFKKIRKAEKGKYTFSKKS